MDIDVFPSSDLDTVFRVLRTALTPESEPSPPERAFLATYGRITGHDPRPGWPEPIRPEDARLEGAHQRKRLVQLAAAAALLHCPVRAESAAFVRDLASALSVPEPVVPVLLALSRGQKLRARLLTSRRGLAALSKEAYQKEGAPGVLRFFAGMFLQSRVNKDKLSSYKRLGLLPEGTLGREYWKHMTELGFCFPGEAGGIPDSVAYHDIAHTLTGYDTTPAGEIQQGCLQAGNRRQDGFFFFQFAVLQFHHGIQLTPVAAPEVGYFDPEKVLWAVHRGASASVDFTHQWNYWPLMDLPLSEARAQCALLPALG